METHNYFTIRSNEATQVVTNVALGIGGAIKNNIAYAKYIAFGSGGGVNPSGKIINIVKVLPVRLADINSDPTLGLLHAEYASAFSLADKGIVFSELSLCSGADGSGGVNYATCEPITVDTEPCSVSVTIFAELDGEVKLCGGDNAIARFLLGASNLSGVFEMASGGCTYPNKPLNRGEDTLVKRVAVTPIFTESGIAFESSELSSKVEFVVLVNSRATLRILPNYTTQAVNGTSVVNMSQSAGIKPHNSYEVFNVSMNGSPITSYEVIRSVTSSTRLVDMLPFNVGKVSRLIIDDESRFIACVTPSDVILLDSDMSGFKIIMRLAYKGEFVEVLSGGAIALWSQTLKIYKTAKNEPYTLSEITLQSGESNAIVRDGAYYHAARIFGGKIERYKISGANYELVASVVAGAKQYLFRDGSFLAYCGASCPTGVYTLAQRNTYAEGYITEFFGAYPSAEIVINNGVASCKQAGASFVIHLDSQSMVNYFVNSQYSLGNEVYSAKTGTNIELGVLDRWSGALKGAITMSDSRSITGICKTKYIILVLYEDGSMEGIYLNSVDIAIYSPDFAFNNSLTYIAKKKNVPPDTEVGKVRIELAV